MAAGTEEVHGIVTALIRQWYWNFFRTIFYCNTKSNENIIYENGI